MGFRLGEEYVFNEVDVWCFESSGMLEKFAVQWKMVDTY